MGQKPLSYFFQAQMPGGSGDNELLLPISRVDFESGQGSREGQENYETNSDMLSGCIL